MTELRHGYVYTNGIRMHYVEQGEGPLVLLCHGWPECWYSWRHQIPALAEAGFRVVAPDLRGYGQTEAPEAIESYDIINLVADLVGLVQALGEEQCLLVAHDMASIIAGPTAVVRPDMFRALAMLSAPYLLRRKLRPATRFETESQDRHFYQQYFQKPARVEAELEEDIRRSLLGIFYTACGESRTSPSAGKSSFVFFEKNTRMVDNLMLPDNLPSWLTEQDLDFLVGQFKRSGFRGGINWYRNWDRNWAVTSFLDGAKILQPSLHIAGSLDGVLKMAAEDFANLEINVPNLKGKHLLAGAGHWTQQERPAEVTAILLDFLRGCISDGVLR